MLVRAVQPESGAARAVVADDAPLSSGRFETLRTHLEDGSATTLHVARFDLAEVDVRVVGLDPPEPLLDWCRREEVLDAVVGGFFVRPDGNPLGEIRTGGRGVPHVPFQEPWDRSRACIHVTSAGVALASRAAISAQPDGDLLQAGPMLLGAAGPLRADDDDPEGFSTGSHQFDSDITIGRHPRAALGIRGRELITAVCDGRAAGDSGLTLAELAETMQLLGAERAINLDGGGSATLISGGRMRNCPREQHGVPLTGGRAVSTALVMEPRRPR